MMTTAQWANAGPDDAALPALLDRIARRIPVDSIDELWIFPTRTAHGIESTVIVVSTFDDGSQQQEEPGSGPDADRRQVSTAHFTASRDRKGRATVDERIVLHAIAPAAAAARVVEGVVRRLDDDLALPRSERIAGDPARWAALLETLGQVAPAGRFRYQ